MKGLRSPQGEGGLFYATAPERTGRKDARTERALRIVPP